MPEETVQTPEAPVTGKAAFAAARASVVQSQDQEPPAAPPADDTPEKSPVQEPDTVADEPPETTPDETPQLLTPEELAALPPKERAKAEKWQAKLTRASQALAESRKTVDQWIKLRDEWEADPDAVLERLAKTRGKTLTAQEKAAAVQNTTTTAKSATADFLDGLPEEWSPARPFFEQFANQLLAKFETAFQAKLKPVETTLQQMTTEAAAAETESTLKAFEADSRYKDWRKYEKQMTELAQKFIPAHGSMTDFEYMEHLYKLVTADLTKAEQVKQTVAKINKSAESVEPNVSGVQESRVEHALPPPAKRTMRDAFAAAKQGIVWTK